MALSKLTYNSLNVTAAASKAVGFDSGADDLSASLSGGSMTFIKKLTASSSATLSFVDGASDVVLDDTYKEYMFTFKNIHPATDTADLTFNVSIDSGSNYNVAKTDTLFYGYHTENDTHAGVSYDANLDIAQGTGTMVLLDNMGNGNDENGIGYLHLFNPSSTTFVKHFIARVLENNASDQCLDNFIAGYADTTSAIDAVQFKMASGDIDAGTIKMYGVV